MKKICIKKTEAIIKYQNHLYLHSHKPHIKYPNVESPANELREILDECVGGLYWRWRIVTFQSHLGKNSGTLRVTGRLDVIIILGCWYSLLVVDVEVEAKGR